MQYNSKEETIKVIPVYLDLFVKNYESKVSDVDIRLTTYVHTVLDNPDKHNWFEILAVFRFIDFLGKYEFSKKEVQKFFTFYENLYFPAATGMTQFKLLPFQCFYFANMYGFVNEEGNRITRYATLFISRKNSKALEITTPIPTPDGWKTMADLHIGDYVFGRDGKPTKVTDATPIMYDHKCYRVTFEDGDSVIADADHNWYVKGHYEGKTMVLTTKDMFGREKRKRRDGKGTEYLYRIPMNKPVEYEEKELPLDPYVFGVWLADGISKSSAIVVGDGDADYIPPRLIKELGTPTSVYRKGESKCLLYRFGYSKLTDFIRKYNLYGNKHIPTEYLTASVNQRWELLRGIMDGDGYCTSGGQCVITQKNNNIADGIVELLSSLGIKCSRHKRIPKIGDKECDEVNSITFYTDKTAPCFTLPRKVERLKDKLNKRMDWKSIISIEEVDSVPVKCITVDNEDHLYLYGKRYSVTHNSTSVSAIAIYDLLFGDKDAQSYICSNNFAQAENLFKICKAICRKLDPTNRLFHYNKEQIINKMVNRTSFVRCVANNPERQDGNNCSTAIFDEFAAANSEAMYSVMLSSQALRKSPLNVIITTANYVLDGPFVRLLEQYKKILRNEIDNDTIFPYLFMPDEGDDIASVDTWKKVCPSFGIIVREDFYRAEWDKAQLSGEAMQEFKTKLLNIFVPKMHNVWISPKLIDKQTDKNLSLKNLKSRPMAMVAVDLSVKDDMSSVSIGLYSSTLHQFYFINWYYLPAKTIENHPNRELYQHWIDEGYLKICGDEIIDYRMISNDIIALSKQVQILQVNYDRYKSLEMINMLRASGINTKPYGQTYANFTAPVDSFELGLNEGKIWLEANPIIKWNIMNCYVDVDKMQNKKAIKQSENKKVDGLQCILMNLGAFLQYKRK